jgi:hypothetical protein
MSWIITGTEKTPLDQDYRNVSLLLHGDGANGSTTIVDNSPTPKTVTAVGNAQISTAQSKFGGSSIAFDGNGDYLQVTIEALGVSDYTIEAWLYYAASATKRVLQVTGNQNNIEQFTDGRIRFFDGSSVYDTAASTAPSNTWYHFAFSRSGSTGRLFVNGQQALSFSTSVNATGGLWWIGGITNNHWQGYMDDFRLTKGVARYTSNFTPPTAPFPDAGPAQ